METFSIWFGIGVDHILAVNGLDHILFVLTLAIPYPYESYKSVIWLALGFTVGHSLTLLLATLGFLKINQSIIEILIPITIIISSLNNRLLVENNRNSLSQMALACGFGLIHGLGFSGALVGLLGESSEVLLPLLSFNLGVEFGQLIVVAFYCLADFLLSKYLKIERQKIIGYFAFVVIGVAFYMLVERLKDLV